MGDMQMRSGGGGAAATTTQSGSVTTTTTTAEPLKSRICCACLTTKRLRDECTVDHGEDACAKWIEAHRFCLRAEGFNIMLTE